MDPSRRPSSSWSSSCSRLLVGAEEFDEVDPLEREQAAHLAALQPHIEGRSSMERGNILLELCRSAAASAAGSVSGAAGSGNHKPLLSYTAICGALLWAALISPAPVEGVGTTSSLPSHLTRQSDVDHAHLHGLFQNLEFITNDRYHVVCAQLKYLCCHPRFARFHPSVLHNLLWIVDRLLALHATTVDLVDMHVYLLRQIRGGSEPSPGCLVLTNALLSMYQRHQAWVEGTPSIRPYIVFTFTRLIPDHGAHPEVQQREMDLVVRMLRERPSEYYQLGRDFLHHLKQLAGLPAFVELWRDWIMRPSKGSFPELVTFLSTPTPQLFLLSRVTPDMERKVYFILHHVERQVVSGYMERLRARFFPAKADWSVYADLLRYVCGVIHPSNQLLASKVIQRWDFITLLLRGIKSSAHVEQALIAVYLDYLWFDPNVESIMAIEPGILMLYRNKEALPSLTKSIVDLLYRTQRDYLPMLGAQVRLHMSQALHTVLSKKVIGSVVPLYAALDSEHKQKMEQLFPLFIHRPKGTAALPSMEEVLAAEPSVPIVVDGEEWGAADAQVGLDVEMVEVSAPNDHAAAEREVSDNLQQLVTSMEASNPKAFLTALQQGLDLYLDPYMDVGEREHWKQSFLLALLRQDRTLDDFPMLLVETLFAQSPGHVGRQQGAQLLVSLLHDVCTGSQERASLLLRAFAASCTTMPQHSSLFAGMVEAVGVALGMSPAAFILHAIQPCYLYDLPLFYTIFPHLYAHLPAATSAGNLELLRLGILMLDPVSLQATRQRFVLSEIELYQTADIVPTSLEWEAWEQHCFWSLIQPELKRISTKREEFMLRAVECLATVASGSVPVQVAELKLGMEAILRLSAPSKKFLYALLQLEGQEGFLRLLFKNWRDLIPEERLAKAVVAAFANHPARQAIAEGLESGAPMPEPGRPGDARLLANVAACFPTRSPPSIL